jgi:hypothetical protein
MNRILSYVKRFINNPALARGEIRKIGNSFNHWYHQKFYNQSGIDIFEEDWDNLIILDGCRFDTFAERNHLSGRLESRISLGSGSWEFLQENFQDRELHDTVYITANPHFYRLDSGIFHTVIDLLKRWDDNQQTVPPEEVVTAADTVKLEFPKKKYVFHFMQPHYPFLGETGKTINHRGHEKNVDNTELDQPNVWDVLQWQKDPTVTETKVRRAYEENLDIVLNHVENMLETLDGRTVITADHGNLIGDRLHPVPVQGYGHRNGFRYPELVKVPWHVIEADTRRKVTREPPIEVQNREEEDVIEQLTALGYK